MSKKTAPLLIYDGNIDERRPATQQDVDDLFAVTQKLGMLRGELLRLVSAYFPTIAEDLALGAERRGRLMREFYRANGRHPDDLSEAKAAERLDA